MPHHWRPADGDEPAQEEKTLKYRGADKNGVEVGAVEDRGRRGKGNRKEAQEASMRAGPVSLRASPAVSGHAVLRNANFTR